MKKEFIEKRLTIFKETFSDFTISKSGSIYVKLNERATNHKLYLNAANVTKGTLDRLGEKREWVTKEANVILITNKGKMLVKLKNKNQFINLTPKFLYRFIEDRYNEIKLTSEQKDGLKRSFFTGRKYEWMVSYPHLWNLKYFRSFSNLKDAKNYLGYDFLSCEKFLSLIASSREAFTMMIRARDNHQNKINIVQMIENNYMSDFIDYVRMCQQNNRNFQFPRGLNKLKQLHDEQVIITNMGNLNKYSTKPLYYYSPVFKSWDKLGLDYEVIDCERSLFIEGQKQNHCIGSYVKSLTSKQNIFISFLWQGSRYNIQLKNDGYIVQFRGKRNISAPTELDSLVRRGIDEVKRLWSDDNSSLFFIENEELKNNPVVYKHAFRAENEDSKLKALQEISNSSSIHQVLHVGEYAEPENWLF